MKKILALVLVSLMVLSGCGSKNESPQTPEGNGSLKVGSAIINSVRTDNVGANERDPENGKFESNVVYATVVIEEDKVKAVTIDTAQNEIKFSATEIAEFAAKGTKKELGEDYGMSKVPNGKGEWDKQIAAVEKYMVGKSVSELKADSAKSDLSSSVSMDINGYFEVVKAAVENAVEVKGLVEFGQTSTVSGSNKDGKVEINTVVTALGTDKDGKVVYSFADETQQAAEITGGEVVASEQMKTKGQQKEDYGMAQATKKLEWYKQVEEITKYLNGKASADLTSFDADIPSSVSIYSGNIKATIDKAFKNLTKI